MNRGTELLAHLLVALFLAVPELPVPQRAPKPMWQALKTQARLLEVVGPNERWIDDFRCEVRYVRRFMRELRFAPPLDDGERFLPWSRIDPYRKYLDQWECCLKGRAALTPWLHDEYADLQADLRQARELADDMRMAKSEYLSWVSRRRALARLRETLGEELYYGW